MNNEKLKEEIDVLISENKQLKTENQELKVRDYMSS